MVHDEYRRPARRVESGSYKQRGPATDRSSGGIRTVIAAILSALAVLTPAALHAQTTATVVGVVTSRESGAPLAGVRIGIEHTAIGAVTDARGTFRIAGVRAGEATVVAELIGRRSVSRAITVQPGETLSLEIVLDIEAVPIGGVVVSASREAQRKAETAATIGVIGSDELRAVRPAHPSEILNHIAGVWINVTGGEGHMAAIRQPKTTNPVYLYAEDGVPTRSTGFFNHNALYEVNVPQADRIEVVKGPASALYGSDAIGGVVNVVTRPPADEPGVTGSVEGGGFGFARVLAAANLVGARDGVRTELNLTRTDGWRDGTAYDRETGTVRWDRQLSPLASLKTVATFSHIDQSTAGSSAISLDDYQHAPELNYTPISFRKVQALRLSTAYERIDGSTSLSITPFVRWNDMKILPNWSLTYDPAVWETGHSSLGALLKVRRDFGPLRGRIILGTDLDYSPGSHFERAIQPARDGRIFESYTEGDVLYDYDVRFFGVSPYVQAEASPIERIRVIAGLRFDMLGYDYDNALSVLATGRHRRPASTSVHYTHASPKLGITADVAPWLNVFGAYGHGFRAPSEGQLFRQGSAVNTVDLEPVKADNYELGLRGRAFDRISFEASAYYMTKTDDILGFTREDGSTETVNAGETLHRGVELSVGAPITDALEVAIAYSRMEHEYQEWSPRTDVDFSGNEMEDAPNEVGNISLQWRPAFLAGSGFGIEWMRVGSYWLDAANTHRYGGHDLLNVRASVPVLSRVTLFGRLMNVTGERYAESAAFTTARGLEYAPGMPRTFYLGVQYR